MYILYIYIYNIYIFFFAIFLHFTPCILNGAHSWQVPASASASSSSSIISSSPSSPTWILCYRRSEFCFNISQAVWNHPRAVCWQLCRNRAFFRIEATLESSCPAQQCCKLSRLPKSFHSGPVIPSTTIHWCKSTGTFSECQKRNWEINKHLQVDCSPILYKVFPSVLQIFMCKQGVRFWFAAVAKRISCAVQSMCKLCRKTEFYDSEAGPTVRCYLRMATNFSARSLTREPSPQSATQAAGISSSVPMEPKHAPAMDARLAVQPPTLMLASTAST